MAKRSRAFRGSAVVTIVFAASCAPRASTPAETTTPPAETATAPNPPPPPPPLAASIVTPGGSLLRRHEACTLIGPMSACGGEPCPPPTETRIVCPDSVATDGRLERDYAGVCTFTTEVCPPPVLSTCNPPPPRVVPCEPWAVESGLQTPDRAGRCSTAGTVTCPPPFQPPCQSGERTTVTCPQ